MPDAAISPSTPEPTIATHRELEALVLSNQLEKACELYRKLSQPDATHMRWRGLVYLALCQWDSAETMLSAAYAGGRQAAALHLSALHRILGSTHLARTWLLRAEEGGSDPVDQTFWLRESALLSFAEGELRISIERLEDAWVQSFSDERCALLRPGLAQSLGYAHLRRGDTTKATRYFERALADTNPMRSLYTWGALALAHAFENRITQAYQALHNQSTLDLKSEIALSLRQYQAGTVARAAGNQHRALDHYERSRAQAQENGESDVEFYARLGCCAVHLTLGNLSEARRNLARAEELSAGPAHTLIMNLRRGGVALLSGEPEAEMQLEACFGALHTSGYLREAGWTLMWIAETRLRAQHCVTATLERLLDLASALSSAGWIAIELWTLPALSAHLQNLPEDHPAALLRPRQAGRSFRLEMLSGGALLEKGKRIPALWPQVPTVLSYALSYPGCSLESLAQNVFQDQEPEQAKAHLHALAKELQARNLGLTLHISAQGYCTVQTERDVSLECDLLELDSLSRSDSLAALRKYPERHPAQESRWAASQRISLERSLRQNALTALNAATAQRNLETAHELLSALLEFQRLRKPDPTFAHFLYEARATLQDLGARGRPWVLRDLDWSPNKIETQPPPRATGPEASPRAFGS